MQINVTELLHNITISPLVRGIYVTGLNQKVLSSNGSRVAVTFFNYGQYEIFLMPDISNVGFYGYNLPPLGGALQITVMQDLLLPTMPWFASANGGNPELAYIVQTLTLPLSGEGD
jgi:hypothetical protein